MFSFGDQFASRSPLSHKGEDTLKAERRTAIRGLRPEHGTPHTSSSADKWNSYPES